MPKTHPRLTRAEVSAALAHLPPLLTAREACAIGRMSLSTLYSHVSRGRFKTSVRRGKPLLFWRARFVLELFKF